MDLSYGYFNTNDAYGCDSSSDFFNYFKCLSDNYTDFVYLGSIDIDAKGMAASLTQRKWNPLDFDTAATEGLKTKLKFGKVKQME